MKMQLVKSSIILVLIVFSCVGYNGGEINSIKNVLVEIEKKYFEIEPFSHFKFNKTDISETTIVDDDQLKFGHWIVLLKKDYYSAWYIDKSVVANVFIKTTINKKDYSFSEPELFYVVGK